MWVDSQWHWLRWCVVIAAALLAATTDLRQRRIPNALTLPLLLTGLAAWTLVNGLTGLQHSLLGMILAGGPFILLWILGGGGAGDAKMMMGVGAWLGLNDASMALICVALVGGVISIIYAALRGQLGLTFARLLGMPVAMALRGAGRLAPQHDSAALAQRGIPYGLAICLGVGIAATGAWLW